jgi:hypothetical protein
MGKYLEYVDNLPLYLFGFGQINVWKNILLKGKKFFEFLSIVNIERMLGFHSRNF